MKIPATPVRIKVEIVGKMIGTVIYQNSPKKPTPSIFAASTIDSLIEDIAFKYINKLENKLIALNDTVTPPLVVALISGKNRVLRYVPISPNESNNKQFIAKYKMRCLLNDFNNINKP